MGKKKFFDFAIGNPPYQQDMAVHQISRSMTK